MAKIDELLKELCPDGVEWKTLSELGKFFGGLTGKSKSDFQDGNSKYITYKNVYENPSIDLAINDLVFVSDGEKQNIVQFKDVLFTGSSETPNECGMSSVITETPKESYYLNSFCFGFRLNDTSLFNEQFLKHYFRSSAFRSDIGKTAHGVTRFNISKVKFGQLQIPILPLPIQQHIVEVLDTFTDAISNLEEELALREKQFEFYREQLFNFDEGEFEWKYIPELASYSTGLTYKPANVKDTGTLVLRSSNIKNNQLSFEDNVYVQMNIPERSKVQLHDILICVRNGSKNLVGKCAYISNLSSECAFGAFMNILRPYNINSKFLYYSWQLHSTINQYKGDDASPICQITNKDFARIRIKVPSEVRQQEIVEILDTFEAMIANIKEEIALRTKQYEYYREKLLSFGK